MLLLYMFFFCPLQVSGEDGMHSLHITTTHPSFLKSDFPHNQPIRCQLNNNASPILLLGGTTGNRNLMTSPFGQDYLLGCATLVIRFLLGLFCLWPRFIDLSTLGPNTAAMYINITSFSLG